VRSHFGEVVLSTIIPRSVRVSEAPSYGQSVITYDPGSSGAVAYAEAAREVALRSVLMDAAATVAAGAAPVAARHRLAVGGSPQPAKGAPGRRRRPGDRQP